MKNLAICAALLSSVAALRFATFDDVPTVKVNAPGMDGGHMIVNKSDFEADPGKYGDGTLWIDPATQARKVASAAPAAATTQPPAMTGDITPSTAPNAAPASRYADPAGQPYVAQQPPGDGRWYVTDAQGLRFQSQSATGYASQEGASEAANKIIAGRTPPAAPQA